MDLRNNLIKQFGVELPATVIFDDPSTEALAKFITAELPQQADASVYEASEAVMTHAPPAHAAPAPQIDSNTVR